MLRLVALSGVILRGQSGIWRQALRQCSDHQPAVETDVLRRQTENRRGSGTPRRSTATCSLVRPTRRIGRVQQCPPKVIKSDGDPAAGLTAACWGRDEATPRRAPATQRHASAPMSPWYANLQHSGRPLSCAATSPRRPLAPAQGPGAPAAGRPSLNLPRGRQGPGSRRSGLVLVSPTVPLSSTGPGWRDLIPPRCGNVSG